METRDQKYARAAFPKVQAKKSYKKGSDEETKTAIQLEKGYRTLALNFPVMVLQSGLAQSVGFLLAKQNRKNEEKKEANEHKAYLQDLACILQYKSGNELHETIINCNSLLEYQQLTRKTLEASAWLKRYTQALLEADPKPQIEEK